MANFSNELPSVWHGSYETSCGTIECTLNFAMYEYLLSVRAGLC